MNSSQGAADTGEELTASLILDRIEIAGTVLVGETATVTYTVVIDSDDLRGDSILYNVLAPAEHIETVTPPEVCEQGETNDGVIATTCNPVVPEPVEPVVPEPVEPVVPEPVEPVTPVVPTPEPAAAELAVTGASVVAGATAVAVLVLTGLVLISRRTRVN